MVPTGRSDDRTDRATHADAGRADVQAIAGPSSRHGRLTLDQLLAALAQLARLTVGAPPAQLMVGYLLGNAERVRFVSRIRSDAELAMSFGVHRRIEVPIVPWQGFIRGVPIPDPLLWVDAARPYRTAPIAVRVLTDDRTLTELLRTLLDPAEQRERRRDLEARIEQLRQEVDRTLDIYGELRRLMAEPGEHDPNLPHFYRMAQQQMGQLGEELARLKERLEET
jgi:hypothetical protein